MGRKYDFGGYVTKNDLRCTDGRIIRSGAFAHCDKSRVPLLYQHQHTEINQVLGYVDLENRSDGVYGWGSFNDTPAGKASKEQVKHGDLTCMSIYANHLVQEGPNVIRGDIREVSLVLSGANPGAVIDNLNFVHADGSFEIMEEEAIIKAYQGIDYFGDSFVSHAEQDDKEEEEATDQEATDQEETGENQNGDSSGEKTVSDVLKSMSKEKREALMAMLAFAEMDRQGADLEEIAEEAQNDPEIEDDGPTVGEVFETFTEEEKQVAYFLITKALEDAEAKEAEDTDESDEEYVDEDEGDDMGHSNIFEDMGVGDNVAYITHADQEAIIASARERGSLKAAFESFAAENGYDVDSLSHGIQDIDVFFPDAKQVGQNPAIISRRMEWVSEVLNGVGKTPFSRVKSTATNLTEEEARAKGYVKGTKKVEEQIKALKRVTGPTTVYKLQKLDRDDVVDIVDFDVVAFIKAEMRVMLDEEIARAYLIGDGRSPLSKDKIDEDCIRPIWTDDEVYSVHVRVDNSTRAEARARSLIDAAIRARTQYRGSGSPTLFIGSNTLTDLRLLKDGIGHRLYKNDQELADELRVSKIVEIDQLDNLTRDVDGETLTLGGIIVNLRDYNVGTNRGGEVNLFDDFDLNYNKLEYLLETRQSGALAQPKSALVLEFASPDTTLDVFAAAVPHTSAKSEEEASNQQAVSVSQIGNIVLATRIGELESYALTEGGSEHQYLTLDVDTGLDSIIGVEWKGTALTSDDVTEATGYGLEGGHFVYHVALDSITDGQVTGTVEADGFDPYELVIRYVNA